jgi:hypothetical protein
MHRGYGFVMDATRNFLDASEEGENFVAGIAILYYGMSQSPIDSTPIGYHAEYSKGFPCEGR